MENIFLNMINTHDFREKKNKNWFHEKTPFIFRKKEEEGAARYVRNEKKYGLTQPLSSL